MDGSLDVHLNVRQMLLTYLQSRPRLLIVGLYCLEASARGLLLAIVPLRLLAQFGTFQNVTYFYVGAAVIALTNSILVPSAIDRFGSRTVVTASGILIALSAALIATDTLFGVSTGLIGRTLAMGCMEIPLLATIMRIIPRHALGTFEPVRVFGQGVCLAVTPWLGYHLYTAMTWLPFAISFSGGLLFCITSRAMPVGVQNIAPPKKQLSTSFARFFSQPRLVTAWTLALTRSSFWQAFYIYASIFAVSCGWNSSQGANLLSIGLGTLLLVPLWARLGRRFGIRRLLLVAYGGGALSTFASAIVAVKCPSVAPLLLLVSALFASMVDGAGNVLFLRASRPFERTAMAGVYMTFRDVAQFIPITLFALVLSWFQFSGALLILGASFVAATYLSYLIHPRMR